MCTTCGCSDNNSAALTDLQTGKVAAIKNHAYSHEHDHRHEHSHDAKIRLEKEILAKNNLLAEQNRAWFSDRNIVALNLLSSPGSGKTTLLERTINDLSEKIKISVIEGDQSTINDAERIKNTGCKVVQINTGAGCHLEADMLERGIKQLAPPPNSVVMIENVGNLVCPALFDLGEQYKVTILSVTEGEDKPVKYPHIFQAANIMLLNKIDLLPYLKFDVRKCVENARSVNPDIKIFQLSASSGKGLDKWYYWLQDMLKEKLPESDAKVINRLQGSPAPERGQGIK